jgi:hypothetical protein
MLKFVVLFKNNNTHYNNIVGAFFDTDVPIYSPPQTIIEGCKEAGWTFTFTFNNSVYTLLLDFDEETKEIIIDGSILFINCKRNKNFTVKTIFI